MRRVVPPLDAIDSLRRPLQRGEQAVLRLLTEHLPEQWEIYVHPHLNGLEPDFVLLHPERGIAVIEVKDWDLSKYFTRNGSVWVRRDGVDVRVENPLTKAELYRDEIINLYCPRLRGQSLQQHDADKAVTAAVVFAGSPTSAAVAMLSPLLRLASPDSRLPRSTPIVGIDQLQLGNLGYLLGALNDDRTPGLPPGVAADIRSWLEEPDYNIVQRTPLVLNSQQKALATSRTTSGYRRIRGAVGTGKSSVLAARAIELSSQNKKVLVVTFNITLIHYLRDLAVRYPFPHRRNADAITWLNFHEWCKRTCAMADLGDDYRSMWANRDRAFEEGIAEITTKALVDASDSLTYDAILVDEGQDFRLDWWNTLRKALRPSGEMVLMVDASQDIYGRSTLWTDEAMSGAGFAGQWTSLGPSYRLPAALVPILQKYQEHFLQDAEVIRPVAFQGSLAVPPRLKWIQCSREELASKAVDALLGIPGFADPEPVAFSDFTLLVQTNRLGLDCVALLDELGIRCSHTFGSDSRHRQRAKHAFWMGAEKVKASTIHSFKGWESRALVVAIDAAHELSDRHLVFVGLSRLKQEADRGSYLTVVCAAQELESFGELFETANATAGGSSDRGIH